MNNLRPQFEHEHDNHDRGGNGRKHAEHGGDHQSHHEHMLKDSRRRFWISLALTVPILALSKMIQRWLGLEQTLAFTGDQSIQFALASVVFIYGGWPFLKGLIDELKTESASKDNEAPAKEAKQRKPHEEEKAAEHVRA